MLTGLVYGSSPETNERLLAATSAVGYSRLSRVERLTLREERTGAERTFRSCLSETCGDHPSEHRHDVIMAHCANRGEGMVIAMKMLNKALCGLALGIAGLLGVVFLVDLIVAIPFGRLEVVTDILVVVASGLVIWQGTETWLQLR